jgi:UDP-galactopyranose mutase
MVHYDLVIVGAGLSGATIAQMAAKDNKKILVLEKRNHVAGNCYDEIDSQTGIRINLYGAHLFHTNDEEVWNYVQQFGKWRRWDHKVLADISGIYVPIPVCPITVNALLGETISNEEEMQHWLENNTSKIQSPKNSEDIALNRVGEKLYTKLFKEYTKKQWNKDASDLDCSVLSRIPVRKTFDERYFSDKFQGLPEEGYTSIINTMLSSPNITVTLGVSWQDFKLKATQENITWATLVFTGPIDQYFEYSGLPKLEYRSIEFHWERIPLTGYLQPNSVINYPLSNTQYTRCVEYKHFLHQKSDWTIVARETTCDIGEPYYPVPTSKNQELYEKYKQYAKQESNVHFIGRLASYKYFNMDQAIRNAMDYYSKHLK